MSRPTEIVVGGGLAGTATALRAVDDGAAVVLVEHLPRLGGATWSATRDGLTYDNGQHVFMRCCTEYRAFLERIGSAGHVTLQDRMDVPVLSTDGRLSHLRRVRLPAPLHLSPALSRYAHLGMLDRGRTVRAALALRRLDLDDATLDTQTFAQWLGRRGASAEAINALWNLVCLPTVNLPADEASLVLAAKVFKTGLLESADGGDIGWSNVPLQQLHGDAAQRALTDAGVDVLLSSRVESISVDRRGPRVHLRDEELAADAVVVAVPHDTLDRLLPDGSFEQQPRVSELGRSPIVNVHLLYDRTVLDHPFVAGLHSPVQFAFDRSGSSGAPPGTQMIAISLSAASQYVSWSRQQLTDHFVTELPRLLAKAAAAKVMWSMVTREAAATFRGVPGSASLRATTATRLPGVFLAGAWTDTGWPATMEGAVRSGNRAAAAVRQQLAEGASREGAAA
ncbi:MAG: hydroxysqualene dehydroxylase HpnE [Ilumatobacteraceae bacterium]